MTSNYTTESTKYLLFAKNGSGKWVSQNSVCRHGLTWMQANQRIERLRTLKRGWVGKGEFPVSEIKLVEVRTKVKCTETSTDKTILKEAL